MYVSPPEYLSLAQQGLGFKMKAVRQMGEKIFLYDSYNEHEIKASKPQEEAVIPSSLPSTEENNQTQGLIHKE